MSESVSHFPEHDDPYVTETLGLAEFIKSEGSCIYQVVQEGDHIEEVVGHQEDAALQKFMMGVQTLLWWTERAPAKNLDNITALPMSMSEPGWLGLPIGQLLATTHRWADEYTGQEFRAEHLTVVGQSRTGAVIAAQWIICQDPVKGWGVILSFNGGNFIRADVAGGPTLRILPDASIRPTQ